jgi:hypothetical protein
MTVIYPASGEQGARRQPVKPSRAQASGQVVTLSPCYPSFGGEEHARRERCSTSSCRNARLRDASDCPEPDARLLTAHVELAHVDEVPWRAQEGLASRIRNEN